RSSSSPSVCIGFRPPISSRRFFTPSLAASAPPPRRAPPPRALYTPTAGRELLALAAERLVDARGQVGDLLLDRPLLVALALLELGGDPLGLGRHDLAESGGRLLATLGAGGDHDLAGR